MAAKAAAASTATTAAGATPQSPPALLVAAAASTDIEALQATLAAHRRAIEAAVGLDEAGAAASAVAGSITSVLAGRRRGRAEAALAAGGGGGGWRRSSRVANKPPPPLVEHQIDDDDDTDNDDDRPRRLPSGVPHLPAPPAAGSLRSMRADVARMNATYLGLHVPMALGGSGAPAKRAVMAAACARAGVVPAFSKMSGIQEWDNAIFLFVNLGGEVDNAWLEGGRQLVWFAQQRQSVASAQVQRLIHHASGTRYPPGAAVGDAGAAMLAPCTVALILRSDLDPYVWCGTLRYVSHDPATHPLRFVWQLEDYDALMAAPASLFPGLLAAAAARRRGDPL